MDNKLVKQFSNKKKWISIILIIVFILILYCSYLTFFKSRSNIEGFLVRTINNNITTDTYAFNTSSVWTVQPGVTQATFTVAGGNAQSKFGRWVGPGALVTGTLNVTQGQTYNIYVGNNGNTNDGVSTIDILPVNSRGSGGKTKDTNGIDTGGNGGSVSAIFLNNTPLIVAAGGGGDGDSQDGDSARLFTSDTSKNISNGFSSTLFTGGGGGGGENEIGIKEVPPNPPCP